MLQQKSRFRFIVGLLSMTVFLSGCWSNLEIDRAIMVIGTGFDKSEKGLRITVEVMKPLMSGQEGQDVESLILEETGTTFLDIARRLIRQGKRRLNFSHSRVWIVHEQVAREDIMFPLDVLKRDEMFRLNSYLFITPEEPKEILKTNTLVEKLTSIELAASMELGQFTAEYQSISLDEFYRTMSGPVSTEIVPIIETRRPDKLVTEITGMAIIKDRKMIGSIDPIHSRGLLYLRGETAGGVLTADLNGIPCSIEVVSSKLKLKPMLTEDDQLHLDISIQLKGFLGDVPPGLTTNEQTIYEIEERIEQDFSQLVENVMHKLQKEYKADVIYAGVLTYRKYPKRWQHIKDEWDDIFADATIHVEVDVEIQHEGLSIRSKGEIFKKPKFNPFMPKKSR